eukprot:gnl/MRDRNA2_/MRDRNA2_44795_c0_seq1.p1 gnl/MRDRNA2_/MRDRNA2_44795_c0~~gnl/MRDRNA2_/MRDRNA2_44795_c0_seq1.p1  ORF type:complete len:974 (-),score=212.73 gnl/MRDRNA2_/MRDRNA2_44795_c0_seq1:228-3149(-)
MGDGLYEVSSVQVFVRIRPADAAEEGSAEIFRYQSSRPRVLSLTDPLSGGQCEHSYEFNGIFLPPHGQGEVFEKATKPLVEHVLHGFNACCFAYGQTGSGKTYTIFGEGTGDNRGNLVRCAEHLFERIDQRTEYREVGMAVSFLEIYLDNIRDLAAPFQPKSARSQSASTSQAGEGSENESAGKKSRPQSATGVPSGSIQTGGIKARPQSASGRYARPWSASSQTSSGPKQRPASASGSFGGRSGDWDTEAGSLEIHETANGQVYVKDLTMVPVKDLASLLQVLRSGLSHRVTEATAMNPRSSRSHTVFTIQVAQRDRLRADDVVINGQLNFVDLAGSERLAKSKSEGKRFKEAVLINSSLSALGKVILALASDSRATRHIPYRDSKLTRILSGSLGEASYATLLCTLHCTPENYAESLNSLSFADRCKNVTNRPQVNYIDARRMNQERQEKRLLAEITDLKQQLKGFSDAPSALGPSALGDLDVGGAGAAEHLLAKGASPDDVLHALAAAAADDRDLAEMVARARTESTHHLNEEKVRQQKAEMKLAEDHNILQSIENAAAEEEKESEAQLVELQDKNKRLEQKIQQLKAQVEKNTNNHHMTHKEEARKLQEAAAHEIKKKDGEILKIEGMLKDGKEQLAIGQVRFEERAREMADQHKENLYRLKESHKQELEQLEETYKQWLAGKKEESDRFKKGFEEYHGKQRKELENIQDELLSLYETLARLSKIIHDAEVGLHPIVRNGGFKRAIFPPGAIPRMPSEEGYEKLFGFLADVKKKATAQANRMSNGTMILPDDHEPNMDTMAHQNGHWNANEYARAFCSVERAENEEAAVQDLSCEQLLELCISLRQRSCELFSPAKERATLEKEALAGLQDSATEEYVRRLEERVKIAKSQYADAQERSRRMRWVLESRKATLRAGSPMSRPPTASSQATTAFPPGSRPASSGPSRPVSAGAPVIVRRRSSSAQTFLLA